MPQFTSNSFLNPTMNTFTRGSETSNWNANQMPENAQWNQFFNPNRAGSTGYFNPYTSEMVYNPVDPGVGIKHGNIKGAAGSNMLSWTDPKTGQKIVNPGALMNMFGGLGGATGNNYTPSEFEGPTITTPGGWGGYDFNMQTVDPAAAIEANKYKMQETLDEGFAQAGNRLGKSGWSMSTGYTGDLGDTSRKAAQDMNEIIARYTYDASKFNREQELAQQLAEQQASLASWQAEGGWDLTGQMGNAANALAAWQALERNRLADANFDATMSQDQQNMIMSMIGGLI